MSFGEIYWLQTSHTAVVRGLERSLLQMVKRQCLGQAYDIQNILIEALRAITTPI